MRRAPRAAKICTVCEEISEIDDSMKDSSSPMKNKVGAQKGAFIKMKQENIYIYQWLYRLCCVPIIAPSFRFLKSTHFTAPECMSVATVRKTNRKHPKLSDVYCYCSNVECGHTFVMNVSFSHTISPSALSGQGRIKCPATG